jgi:hypothetical protein
MSGELENNESEAWIRDVAYVEFVDCIYPQNHD